MTPEPDAEDHDIDDVDPPMTPVQTIVSANGLPMARTKAPPSVWHLGGVSMIGIVVAELPAERSKSWAPVAVSRKDGTTLCTGSHYPSNRWTEEREEQERVRRAKQRPPKPTRKARKAPGLRQKGSINWGDDE